MRIRKYIYGVLTLFGYLNLVLVPIHAYRFVKSYKLFFIGGYSNACSRAIRRTSLQSFFTNVSVGIVAFVIAIVFGHILYEYKEELNLKFKHNFGIWLGVMAIIFHVLSFAFMGAGIYG